MAQKKKKETKSKKARKANKRNTWKVPLKKEKFVKIENPYRPYDLLSGNWPHHDKVIKQIKEIFENHPENKIINLQGAIGPGKTSVLKRLENCPSILGNNYIPIYLDSKKYIDLDVDEFLFAIYGDITEKMNKYGIKTPKPDYIKEFRIKGRTLSSYILFIDPFINADQTMVLMFDEFDILFENTDVKVISDCIKMIKNIEKNWSTYALIFASDMRLTNITNNEIINQAFDMSYSIDLDEIFDKKVIKSFILEPVKNQLTYDEDALERIIWYSGKNLYFQQLICHYLVNHLNEENKNRCSTEDVEIAVKKILNEERPEFIYAWENKLSVEAQLVASALADTTVIQNREQFYFLKEKILLGDIFGAEIFTEIKKFQDSGYFNPIQGRRFSQYPFKIPLYGKWIQNERPFIRTIIENIEFIASKIDLKTLIKVLGETSDDKLLPFNKEPIWEIADKWLSIIKNIAIKPINKSKIVEYRASVRCSMEDFLESLSALLNFDIKIKSKSEENYFIIDIKNLNIGILDEAFCFIQDRPELTKSDIFNIERKATSLAENTQTQLTLFIHFQSSGMVEEIVKKTYLNLITIEENDIKKIILSRRPSEVFRKIILSKLSLQKISPYQTEGPTKATFYGRSDIINRTCSSPNKSFAIVGGRKIGKTSLLYKIKDNPSPDAVYIFLSLEAESGYRSFLKNLEHEIERTLHVKVRFNRFFLFKDVSMLPEFFRRLSTQHGKKIVLILDETDELIEFDRKRKFKLMRLFRTMSQKNYCQFIFSGFEELYQTKRNYRNPMYNFCEEIRLEPLDKESAIDLVTKPMENIGIQYKSKNDRELILYYTGRHPNLLQLFCMHLIKKLEKHEALEDRRTISLEDVKKIFGTTYQDYIMDEIYMFKLDLGDIEKLILILLAEEQLKKNGSKKEVEVKSGNGEKFSVNQIMTKLTHLDIKISDNELSQHLRNLEIRSILIAKGTNNYCFALSVFPEILKKYIDEDYKKRIIKEVKENAAKSL